MDKHAPRSVGDLVIENERTRQRLEDYATGDRNRHMIMHGPKGTGKSSAARVIAEQRCTVVGTQAPFSMRNGAKMTAADFEAILNEWQWQQVCGVEHPVTIIEEVDKLSAHMRDLLQGFIDEYGKHGQIIATSNNLDGLSHAQADRFDQVKMPAIGAAVCEGIRSTRTGSHFSTVSLSLRMKAIYAAAGISTSSHAGRRTFATRLNAAGIGMATIQQAMGHSNIATTAGYCWVSDDQLKNAVSVS